MKFWSVLLSPERSPEKSEALRVPGATPSLRYEAWKSNFFLLAISTAVFRALEKVRSLDVLFGMLVGKDLPAGVGSGVRVFFVEGRAGSGAGFETVGRVAGGVPHCHPAGKLEPGTWYPVCPVAELYIFFVDIYF